LLRHARFLNLRFDEQHQPTRYNYGAYALAGFSEMSILIEALPDFYKQRDNLFYPAWAFALPVTLLRIPYSLLESFLLSIVVYWAVGLAPTAARSAADSRDLPWGSPLGNLPLNTCGHVPYSLSEQEGRWEKSAE
jgi:hypothetical protein